MNSLTGRVQTQLSQAQGPGSERSRMLNTFLSLLSWSWLQFFSKKEPIWNNIYKSIMTFSFPSCIISFPLSSELSISFLFFFSILQNIERVEIGKHSGQTQSCLAHSMRSKCFLYEVTTSGSPDLWDDELCCLDYSTRHFRWSWEAVQIAWWWD